LLLEASLGFDWGVSVENRKTIKNEISLKKILKHLNIFFVCVCERKVDMTTQMTERSHSLYVQYYYYYSIILLFIIRTVCIYLPG
jgi:hypothetical protein